MKIKIPYKTPSVNKLYFVWNGRKILTSPARKLKGEIKDLVKKHRDASYVDKILKITVEVHENWWYKNGKVKRSDVSNREKFLIDSVFEGLGLEDKWIFDHNMKKIQNDKEFSLIKIEKIDTETVHNTNNSPHGKDIVEVHQSDETGDIGYNEGSTPSGDVSPNLNPKNNNHRTMKEDACGSGLKMPLKQGSEKSLPPKSDAQILNNTSLESE